MKPTPTFLPEPPGRILAFGAHPDDIEFGCGGVIARETQAGHAAHFVVGSRGEAATHGTPEQRAAEATRGREKLHFLNPVPLHEIAERWIGKYERGHLRALADVKRRLEGESDE